MRAGRLVLDGEPIVVPRDGDKWRFQLHHIEKITHALFEGGILSEGEFSNSLILVKTIASNYRLI